MSNNTYKTVWNATLNALPKDQRGAYKLNNIAAVERSKVGTPSYRILNQVELGLYPRQSTYPWKKP